MPLALQLTYLSISLSSSMLHRLLAVDAPEAELGVHLGQTAPIGSAAAYGSRMHFLSLLLN